MHQPPLSFHVFLCILCAFAVNLYKFLPDISLLSFLPSSGVLMYLRKAGKSGKKTFMRYTARTCCRHGHIYH